MVQYGREHYKNLLEDKEKKKFFIIIIRKDFSLEKFAYL